ncbi:hypothetical protein [Burkholderia arboris]|uniref:hypothetical protein n=1 Tax=Burkholderia arboris TaxID=488730 RepID=UPI00210C53DF|nr:hypothetical protein [Burkholderia arboris]UTV55763.1 hypothetical protein NLX30_05110 [Burkholderia arboris]
MTPSPLVPVEGALARPRVAPLDRVPPFGREWKFRGAPGARPSKNCLATLTTSCIDVDRPHRACRWQPLPVMTPVPASAGSPITPAAAGRRFRHTAGGPHDRRAMYAICWTLGALGIIGWLIAAHEPSAGFGPVFTIPMASTAPDHATSFTSTVRAAADRPGPSTHAAPPRTAATPVTKTVESRPAPHGVARRPAPPPPKATSDMQRTAAASPHRANDPHPAPPSAATPTVRRLAARPPRQHIAVTLPARERHAPPPLATDTLDDPLTLIATANTLRGTEPARATHASAAGFDWTSQLSHRRMTDMPDAFAH